MNTIKKGPLIEFSQSWLFEPFFEKPYFHYRRMFGGLAIYLYGRMVAVLTQNDKDWSWNGVKYSFPIWDGILVCTDYQYHQSLIKDLKGTINHPVLKKWLYLPQATTEYESSSQDFIQLLRIKDPRIGIEPSVRKRKTLKKASRKTKYKKRKPAK